MQTPVQQTREACRQYPVILVPQDTTYLDYGRQPGKRGLAPLYTSDQHQGMMQHSALALTPEGRLIGLLHTRHRNRVQVPDGETRAQRRARWSESDLWPETVAAIGRIGPETRVIHLADAAADDFKFFHACDVQGHGFITPAQHDRWTHGHTERLRSFMDRQSPACGTWIDLPARPAITTGPKSKQCPAQPARRARVEVRFAPVALDPPTNDPRYTQARRLHVVAVREVDAPEGVEPIDWVLLTSEPVMGAQDALRIITWYRFRWRIEEWHRAQKEGCRLESSQLQEAAALRRLAAITAIVAVRLIQLRDLADDPATADRPEALQHAMPWLWIAIVAMKAKHADPTTFTPRQFWRALARIGGHLGRQGDGRPGWRAIWRGYTKTDQWVHGAAVAAKLPPPPDQPGRCV